MGSRNRNDFFSVAAYYFEKKIDLSGSSIVIRSFFIVVCSERGFFMFRTDNNVRNGVGIVCRFNRQLTSLIDTVMRKIVRTLPANYPVIMVP